MCYILFYLDCLNIALSIYVHKLAGSTNPASTDFGMKELRNFFLLLYFIIIVLLINVGHYFR